MRAPTSSIMQEEEPGRSPYSSSARRPDPPLSPFCACRQGPGRCHPGAAGAPAPRPRRPPAASALLLQLLARQGVRLLLPPGHHLGEHSRVSYCGDPGGLLGAGDGGRWHAGKRAQHGSPWPPEGSAGPMSIISSNCLTPMGRLPEQYRGMSQESSHDTQQGRAGFLLQIRVLGLTEVRCRLQAPTGRRKWQVEAPSEVQWMPELTHTHSAMLPRQDLPRIIIQLMTAPMSGLCRALCQAGLVHDHRMNAPPHTHTHTPSNPSLRQAPLLSPNDR